MFFEPFHGRLQQRILSLFRFVLKLFGQCHNSLLFRRARFFRRLCSSCVDNRENQRSSDRAICEQIQASVASGLEWTTSKDTSTSRMTARKTLSHAIFQASF